MPLFVIPAAEDDPSPVVPLDEIRAACFERGALQPNRSTAEEPQASTARVHGLDAATRDVVAAILRATAAPTFMPGDTVALTTSSASSSSAATTLRLPRKVGAAELGRLRRQFVRINEAQADTITNPAAAFVAFLASSL
jgi:tRNA uridine 5-carbamoylmethylation protein Kti12